MTSLVSEVLASAGKFKKEELHSKLASLSTKGDELRAHVSQFLTSRYADFNVVLASTCTLYNQVKSLTEEVEQTAKRIETEMRVRLDASTQEFEELSHELRNCEVAARALEHLMAAHECLQQAERSVAAQSYRAASEALSRLQHVLATICESSEGSARVVQALHTECIVQRESLRHALGEHWNCIVSCTFKETVDHRQGHLQTGGSSCSSKQPLPEVARLRVADASSGANLGDILSAMDGEGMLDARLRDLARLLLQAFFNVLVKDYSATLAVLRDIPSQSHILTLTVDALPRSQQHRAASADSSGSSDVSPKPRLVLEKLRSALNFVHERLSPHCGDVTPSVMRRLGSHIAAPLLESVVDECLALAVPRSHRDLDAFKAVADDVAKFQAFLTTIEFLPAGGNVNVLSDYVSNVHILFANKKCQEILEHARELMKEDLLLHVKKLRHEDEARHVEPVRTAEDRPVGTSQAKQMMLHRNTFRMPSCSISESASGLIDYAHQMLQEAADSSSYSDEGAATRCAAQIFCCVRGMFELYCAVSPVYHRQQVEQLPQAAALFYNNSMYLAHELLTLGHAYRHKWVNALDADFGMSAATFVDLVPKIRALGTDCFLQQVHRQKQLLAESLKSADGFRNLEEGVRFGAAERSIAQCLSILRHLKAVWSDVLPVHTYLKAIGALLNGVLEEMVRCVLDLEDITEQAGRFLEQLFDKISDVCIPLFVASEDAGGREGPVDGGRASDKSQLPQPPAERPLPAATAATAGLLQRHTPKWQRFKELQRLFSASLHDVSERWADGKGPLAAEFSPADVRQLVRALFQNTERRAAVLAKIR